MKKIKIGIAGFDNYKVSKLKKIFKKITFIELKANNFFVEKELDAITIFTEGSLLDSVDKFFIEEKFRNFKKLKWFHLSRAGVEEYSKKFSKLHFTLTCGKIIQGPNVSEHCLALLLYISRGLKFVNDKKKLLLKRPIDLYKKKALVVGLGGIGTLITQKLNAFGMKVSSVDVKYNPHSYYLEKSFLYEDLKDIVCDYDVIINSCSLTKKTTKLFNKKIFTNMKKNSILINVSRGGCVDTNDLISFLEKKKFYGVGLDVIDPEPLPNNHKIRKFPEVFFSDHTAGWSENLDRRFQLVIDNIIRFENNENLLNIVKEY